MTARNVKTLKHEKTTQITYNPTQPISKLLFLYKGPKDDGAYPSRILEPKAGITWVTPTDMHTFK